MDLEPLDVNNPYRYQALHLRQIRQREKRRQRNKIKRKNKKKRKKQQLQNIQHQKAKSNDKYFDRGTIPALSFMKTANKQLPKSRAKRSNNNNKSKKIVSIDLTCDSDEERDALFKTSTTNEITTLNKAKIVQTRITRKKIKASSNSNYSSRNLPSLPIQKKKTIAKKKAGKKKSIRKKKHLVDAKNMDNRNPAGCSTATGHGLTFTSRTISNCETTTVSSGPTFTWTEGGGVWNESNESNDNTTVMNQNEKENTDDFDFNVVECVINNNSNNNNNNIGELNFDGLNDILHPQPPLKKRKTQYKITCPTYCAPKPKES